LEFKKGKKKHIEIQSCKMANLCHINHVVHAVSTAKSKMLESKSHQWQIAVLLKPSAIMQWHGNSAKTLNL